MTTDFFERKKKKNPSNKKKNNSGIKDRRNEFDLGMGTYTARPTLMQDANELWDVCSICSLLSLVHFIRRGHAVWMRLILAQEEKRRDW